MTMSHEPEGTPRLVVTPRSIRAVGHEEGLLFPLSSEETRSLVRVALDEDGAFQDVTTIATVRSDRRTHATLVARQKGNRRCYPPFRDLGQSGGQRFWNFRLKSCDGLSG